MSENRPPKTAFGAEPPRPQRKRKIRRAGKVGANAHAMVKRLYIAKVVTKIGFRPKRSLKGPKMRGPIANPAM